MGAAKKHPFGYIGAVMVHPTLIVVMDGIGLAPTRFGNAFELAKTPNLDKLRESSLYTTLTAHGTAVGMPSDGDLGNSEVGHNAIGAGRIFDQGAKLVDNAISSGRVFDGSVWKSLIANPNALHFVGLLSDGNVHSHENHLHSLIRRAKQDGVRKVFVHALLDGRDVPEKSAEVYAERLEKVFAELNDGSFTARVASGGGRMNVTMDRYEADWRIVERGWHAHVLGEADLKFSSLAEAISKLRSDPSLIDQYFPPFVITEGGSPVGSVADGDAVVFFNFRGDRAIEICQAFESESFEKFNRVRHPKVKFAGMMQYDGDLKIPESYLVDPPEISDTLGEHLANQNLRQFACSETQKFGHVTYFWNGNRSGKFNDDLEEYVEIPSDLVPFDQKPEMKAKEIAAETIQRMEKKSFDCGRINFANGDMVGHTGVLPAAIKSVEVVDEMIGLLVDAADANDFRLVVTADHGNCDEMFDGMESDFPDWESGTGKPAAKTSHSLNPVPCYVYNAAGFKIRDLKTRTLANIANTTLDLLGLNQKDSYEPSLLEKS